MKIKNIEELKKYINKSTMMVFILIFGSAITGLYITHNKFIEKQILLNNQKISFASDIFKSALSEKLGIIASSTSFLDYIRSGEVSRKKLYPALLSQISSLKERSIVGMEILDNHEKKIFNLGLNTPDFVILKLCYINQTLDPLMGDCQFKWKLYFNINELSRTITSFNKSIHSDPKNAYKFIRGIYFGSFPILGSSAITLPIGIQDEIDYFFYASLFLVTIALILFGSWSWYRLSSLLNNYISVPISHLANCLKSDFPLNAQENIEEIQFLIDQIEKWKIKINQTISAENSARLASIAAQLAHDVRSPLTAIDMLVKSIHHIPENIRVTLHNATQRISDISNNFLLQYTKPNEEIQDSALSSEYIPSILESMVSEKRNQYIDKNIKILLSIDDHAWDTFSPINSIDFKRVLSNLMNNSVEAINLSGTINIKLKKSCKYLRIEISDNGIGIAENMLPTIIQGGISIGKKNGSGLGLSHAISKIESWQGSIDIESKINEGTTVGIHLPLSSRLPNWFKFSLDVSAESILCILDDEFYTHHAWINRLKNIRPLNSLIKNFYTVNDAESFLKKSHGNHLIFLVDYDLGQNQLSGLDFILKHGIQAHSTLVTNRHDDADIQKQCMHSDIKIIPKNLISCIPVNIN